MALKQVKEHGSLFDFNTVFGDKFQYYSNPFLPKGFPIDK